MKANGIVQGRNQSSNNKFRIS